MGLIDPVSVCGEHTVKRRFSAECRIRRCDGWVPKPVFPCRVDCLARVEGAASYIHVRQWNMLLIASLCFTV